MNVRFLRNSYRSKHFHRLLSQKKGKFIHPFQDMALPRRHQVNQVFFLHIGFFIQTLKARLHDI